MRLWGRKRLRDVMSCKSCGAAGAGGSKMRLCWCGVSCGSWAEKWRGWSQHQPAAPEDHTGIISDCGNLLQR